MVPNSIFIGSLSRDTIINAQNRKYVDFIGGDVLYAAFASLTAGNSIGLISKIDENFPEEWIQNISFKGIDTEGILRVPNEIEHRRFFRVFKDPRKGPCLRSEFPGIVIR